jgi:hypothetical protein
MTADHAERQPAPHTVISQAELSDLYRRAADAPPPRFLDVLHPDEYARRLALEVDELLD